LQLFIGRLEILVGLLQLIDDGMQIFVFLFQFCSSWVSRPFFGLVAFASSAFSTGGKAPLEHHQDQIPVTSRSLTGWTVRLIGLVVAVGLDLQPRPAHGLLARDCAWMAVASSVFNPSRAMRIRLASILSRHRFQVFARPPVNEEDIVFGSMTTQAGV
jgi:hypothetical protein